MPDTPEYNVHILVNLDIVAITIGHDPVTWEANEDENSNTYTISGNKVKWLVEPYVDQILQYNDIDVLPSDIIVDAQSYTTRSGGSTMNFKHFYDAGLQGSGTIKFRHYSQTEPSSGEMWVLNDTLTGSTLEDITVPTFVSNGHTFQYLTWNNETYVIKLTYIDREDRDNDVTVYYGDDDHDFKGWLNQAYRTITFSTSPTGDLLTWLQANGTKQGGGGAVTGIT